MYIVTEVLPSCLKSLNSTCILRASLLVLVLQQASILLVMDNTKSTMASCGKLFSYFCLLKVNIYLIGKRPSQMLCTL